MFLFAVGIAIFLVTTILAMAVLVFHFLDEAPNIQKKASVNVKAKTIKKNRETELADVKVSKKIRPPGCPHHLGYLRSHPRNPSIPEECLSCPKILKCLGV